MNVLKLKKSTYLIIGIIIILVALGIRNTIDNGKFYQFTNNNAGLLVKADENKKVIWKMVNQDSDVTYSYFNKNNQVLIAEDKSDLNGIYKNPNNYSDDIGTFKNNGGEITFNIKYDEEQVNIKLYNLKKVNDNKFVGISETDSGSTSFKKNITITKDGFIK
ncbi:hypothetical protein AKUH3B204M_06710 [Apilactobacillus kunkeei]|uniref:hypothetical protein n=1 Tax=Apilactobacillus kunkeei TaxID=148814 RepID=UPI00220B94E9|nr:hypothetical protein [Apilactobacillus kunkeei]UZX33820.1 hypothetical protein LDX55_03350 [Apilactobacillus kunkeei]CAI2594140.1 hypothetical protein AKUH3B203M01_09410 [Apilactobacillus kunkeei]CAI2594346.1 hypothetical protein AKUH3B203M_06680 [Apilactobacillus kunkeei]CAI2594434.1 hypothetical protein AKUH3B204M_06710 [Apilactobacillus kunkeei]CAI2594730.1 hypothetical protein AKUH4B206J_06690 [Apilactobacillus kunkeei]